LTTGYYYCTDPTSTATATSTSTSANCVAATACCNALGATYGDAVAQSCLSTIAGASDSVCLSVVTTYQSAGYCP
jgi:hypothetical protein